MGSRLSPSVGNRLLKVAVVILCSINAVMWEFYTESTVMAVLWAATAVAFTIWIADDVRRGI
jgi:membrane protein YdbS with pleckstrin-like domain